MGFEDLSAELQEKARACKSKEELAELAKAVGVHLSEDELNSMAGGTCIQDCPWDGAICRNDYNCITKTACPTKSSCKELFSCIPKNCTDFSSPIPICEELAPGDE